MRRFTRFAAVFVLVAMTMVNANAASSAGGSGAQWVQLDENEESTFFYDKDATKQDKGVTRIKTRVVYSESGKADALATLSKSKDLAKLSESQYEYEVRCPEQESRLLTVAHLDKKGKTLRATDLGSVTAWEPVPEGVRLTLVLEQVCPK